ncbi:MmcQ/YjbR family DNA-binding protein [Kitasatospora sp. MBT63]|uniref:MmcQ/YjbR family DNA-binding protein n=1 Tax=Kitasatospora sp. MBT63 TaxID=1444768 RepID=UPI00053B8DA6|nr:MmcQ/YjbR family DNA-binding protein [Kitasatospora sp. MBT63]
MVTFDQFEALALDLPEAHAQPTWDQVTLRVGRKIFAMGSPDSGRVCVKASKEDQAELLAADPDTYAFAPYVGRHGWVLVQLARVDAGELGELLTEAWRSVAPKRLHALVDEQRANER